MVVALHDATLATSVRQLDDTFLATCDLRDFVDAEMVEQHLDGVEDTKGVTAKSPDHENASIGFKRIAASAGRLG